MSDFYIRDGVLVCYTGSDTVIRVPQGVRVIGQNAFINSFQMTALELPEGVHTIRACALEGHSALQRVSLPSTLRRIESKAFCGCDLTQLTLPDGLETIGTQALAYNTNLTELTLPPRLRSIGRGAFMHCSSLTAIAIPDSITRIRAHTFSECTALREVRIPDSVTAIGKDAFFFCRRLVQLYAGGVTTLTAPVVHDRDGIPLVFPSLDPARAKSSLLAATLGFLSQPERYSDEYAEAYRRYICRQRARLLPIILRKDDVRALSIYDELGKITRQTVDDVFLEPAMKADAKGCVAFLLDRKARLFPTGDTSRMERELMRSPFNVRDMRHVWSYRVLEDGTLCLTNYKGDEPDIVVPARIGNKAVTALDAFLFSPYRPSRRFQPARRTFFGDTLRSVLLPDSITVIGESAFSGCRELFAVNLPHGITELREAVFSECRSLSCIEIPHGVCAIGHRAFYYCSSLLSVSIPDSVTAVGSNAFYCCSHLSETILPDSVTCISTNAFYGCHGFRP